MAKVRMKFYIDGDEAYPTICGTGMEDYFGGSWSFARAGGRRRLRNRITIRRFSDIRIIPHTMSAAWSRIS